jgi:phosphatidate cytidylyltransferase
MLKQRVITALLLVIVVLAAVLLLSANLFAVTALVVFLTLGGWEWSRLIGLKENKQAFAVITLIVLGLLSYLLGMAWYVIAFGVVWWVMILGLLTLYRRNSDFYSSRSWLLSLSGVLVLIPAWLAITELQAHDPRLVIYLIFLVAATDTGAYFVGKAIGKNKLAPHLSPGKTLEGAKGGLAAALFWAVLGAWYFEFQGSAWFYFILLSIVSAAVSIAGDLFESLIKREGGYKDSGSLLPGHGGILDRIDGLLAALPVFVLGLSASAIQQAI